VIPKETIDEIFQTARVEEVLADFMQMKKSGSNYKAKSPFVDEKTPSFMISPAKQIWKCFSSGKGGNVVTFLMEAEHMSYPEALRWLADKYNIDIKEDKQRTPEEVQAQSIRENLAVVNEFAKNHFSRNLTESEQGKAIGLSYFLERGFREDTIKKFDLGYCLDEPKGFTDPALAKGYKLEFLEKAGLTKSKDGRQFDFYRGRVIFPIHSIAGKVLGFGGRTLKSDKRIAKYYNSPETELYNKSKILYGLYYAKSAIIKYDTCYLVEGYTDVISMHQSGVENVVASSGTSLTEGQINLIKRYSDNITILFDGDAAGIKASFRGIDMILSHGMNVKVVLFPDGEDPDSYAKGHSTEEVKSYIEDSAKDFIVFKSDILLKDAGNDPIKKAGLIGDIVNSISLIPDSIKQQVYIQECSKIFDISEQILMTELAKSKQLKLEKEQKQARYNKPRDQVKTTIKPPSRFAKPQTQSPSQQQSHDEPPPEALIPLEYLTDAERAKLEEYNNRPKTIAPQPIVLDHLYHQEFDVIRILLNYGTYLVKTENTETNEKGKEIEKVVEVSVIELIIHEFEKDEITFDNHVFQSIYNEYKMGCSDDTFHLESHFTQHQDLEISKLAVDILADTKELSYRLWEKFKVNIPSEVDQLDRAAIDVIYSYKSSKMKSEIEKIQEQILTMDYTDNIDEILILMAQQMKFEKVKLAMSEKLGRTII
jgi:DNA primase